MLGDNRWFCLTSWMGIDSWSDIVVIQFDGQNEEVGYPSPYK
jgi:DNA-directed RNA polymerase delta subunit